MTTLFGGERATEKNDRWSKYLPRLPGGIPAVRCSIYGRWAEQVADANRSLISIDGPEDVNQLERELLTDSVGSPEHC